MEWIRKLYVSAEDVYPVKRKVQHVDRCAICKKSLDGGCNLRPHNIPHDSCSAEKGFCGHEFHECCIASWIEASWGRAQDARCPLCDAQWFSREPPELPAEIVYTIAQHCKWRDQISLSLVSRFYNGAADLHRLKTFKTASIKFWHKWQRALCDNHALELKKLRTMQERDELEKELDHTKVLLEKQERENTELIRWNSQRRPYGSMGAPMNLNNNKYNI
jgi:ribosomal protein L34E